LTPTFTVCAGLAGATLFLEQPTAFSDFEGDKSIERHRNTDTNQRSRMRNWFGGMNYDLHQIPTANFSMPALPREYGGQHPDIHNRG
jgi:hypothetical protein